MTDSGIDWSCVPFTKSSHSKGDQGQCVEIATAGGKVAIRDSKLAPHSPILELSKPAFAAFIATIRATTYDQSAGPTTVG
jgi:uncharacterized protein DUF397